MRAAYADPPYVGQAKKHYGPEAREVNHEALINHLENDFDTWALSCSTPSLHTILPMCPPETRIMAWVKPFCIFKPNVNPAFAWEPVLVKLSDRKRGREMPTVRDWIACNITLRRGLTGVKPDDVCVWLFEVMNLHPEDEFTDLFPGSGAVSAAWENWNPLPSVRKDLPSTSRSV